jgi:AmmeMemoRadiSam system protein B
VEVQVPFIQYINPLTKIVPLTLSSHHLPSLEELGRDIATSAKDLKEPPLILASSDMTHYEDQKSAQEKDDAAIQKILALDPGGLLKTVEERAISMCGVAPAVAMLTAAKQLGASSAILIKYQTSGDVVGDRSQVVGYAGIIVR